MRRLLADPRVLILSKLTTQWLSITKMKTVNINRIFFRFSTPCMSVEEGQEQPFRPTIRDYMHEETVGFVDEPIRKTRVPQYRRFEICLP